MGWSRRGRRFQKPRRGSVSLRWSAASCSSGSSPWSQNFSLPFTRRLICLMVDSMWLLVIGNPSLRYSAYFIRGRSFELGHPLVAHPLGPPLDAFGGDFDFGQRVENFGRLHKRTRLRPSVGDLLQQAWRERAIGLNADPPGQREKKPADRRDSSTPVRRW